MDTKLLAARIYVIINIFAWIVVPWAALEITIYKAIMPKGVDVLIAVMLTVLIYKTFRERIE